MNLLVLLFLTAGDPSPQAPPAEVAVGMPLRLRQVVLPGPRLEALPWTDRRQDFVVRVLEAYPHGDAFRYDLECVGYAPGDYDLREHLRRVGGAAAPDLPSIAVRIVPSLPPGQIEPHALAHVRSPRLGGYRLLLLVLGLIWLAGLLVLARRYSRRSARPSAASQPPPSLAERLRPLVERAQQGDLTVAQQAEVERLLLAHWRQRLDLDDAHPAAAIAVLRDHSEAGELLRRLEAWLHDPQAQRDVDLGALLAPYRHDSLVAPRGPRVGANT